MSMSDYEPEPCNWEAINKRCHGTGVLKCLCAGDFCVCGFHGEAECDGCPDCEMTDDEYYEPAPEGQEGA